MLAILSSTWDQSEAVGADVRVVVVVVEVLPIDHLLTKKAGSLAAFGFKHKDSTVSNRTAKEWRNPAEQQRPL